MASEGINHIVRPVHNNKQYSTTSHLWRGMHRCPHPRSPTKLFPVLQQQLARFFIERALRIGIYQKTLDCDQDMREPIRRLPVLLEGVHANLTGAGDIGVEDLGEHRCAGRCSRKVVCERKSNMEVASCVGCALCRYNSRNRIVSDSG